MKIEPEEKALIKLLKQINPDKCKPVNLQNKEKEFLGHRIVDEFTEFELKYYLKLLILYKNKNLYKNFEFKKYIKSKQQDENDGSLFSKIQIYLTSLKFYRLTYKKIGILIKNLVSYKNKVIKWLFMQKKEVNKL